MYSSPWFLTLFASTLPLCAAFRILDIYLIDGIEIIFRVGLALLERSQSELLKLDMEDMTKVMILLYMNDRYMYTYIYMYMYMYMYLYIHCSTVSVNYAFCFKAHQVILHYLQDLV